MMSSSTTPSNNSVTFTAETKAAFLQSLRENPHVRHNTQADKDDTIEWLRNPGKRPSSRKESNRRKYVQKTFTWDEISHILWANARKGDPEGKRLVITEDRIADVVESVHETNGHAGQDATWNHVKIRFHGVMCHDVIPSPETMPDLRF